MTGGLSKKFYGVGIGPLSKILAVNRKRGLLSKYKVVPSWLRSWLNVAIDLTGTTAMKLADYCLPMLTLSKELIPYKEGGIHRLLLTFQPEYSFFFH